MDNDKSERIWKRLTESAVVVALVTGLLTVGTDWFKEDEKLCEIATRFLTDDTKDSRVLTDEDWKIAGKFYMKMATENCGN